MHKSLCAKFGLKFVLIFLLVSLGLSANAEITSPWSTIFPNNNSGFNELTIPFDPLRTSKKATISLNNISWDVEIGSSYNPSGSNWIINNVDNTVYYIYGDTPCRSLRVGSNSDYVRDVYSMSFYTTAFAGKIIKKVSIFGGPAVSSSVYDVSCVIDDRKFSVQNAFDGSDSQGPMVKNKAAREVVLEPNVLCNTGFSVEFHNPENVSGKQGFRLCGIVVEFEESTMLPLIVEYNDEVQESDYLTLPVHSEILLSVGGNDNCHYVLSQKNDKTGQISEKVIANGKVTFNNAGRYVFNIDAVDDDSEKIVANRTLHIIVKDDSEINPGDYTLDFERYSYGMTLNPKDNIQTGTDKAFSGVDTNGLDFYIPSGAGYPDNRNQVALVKEDDGAQMLSLTNSGSFKINIDNYNLKITQIKVDGDNLSNLQVVSASHPQGLQMDNDSEFTYTPSENSIVRDFEIRHSPLTRADAVPSHIFHINISTAIETGVDSPVDDSALSDVSNVVYYSISGLRLIGEPTQCGIYIRKSNKGVRKILVR